MYTAIFLLGLLGIKASAQTSSNSVSSSSIAAGSSSSSQAFFSSSSSYSFPNQLTGSFFSSYPTPLVTLSSSSPTPVAAQTTATIAIGNNGQFVASVVDADACATTLKYRCTGGSFTLGGYVGECDNSIEGTYVYGSDFYEISTSIATQGTTAIFDQSCSLAGTKPAVCSVSFSVGSPQTHTSSVTLTTMPISFYPIPITAGASKLSGLGQCTATANAAAPTGVDVYKVLVVPGAAALLAAAAL